jgi:PKD repeat protein/glucose/arabinose dehydrogenase
VLLASLALLWAVASGPTRAETLTGTFADQQVVGELDKATIARFAPDGEVFVAAQDGLVDVFPNLTSTTPTQVINLGVGGTEEVYDEGDRGLLGMAVDPSYPSRPYLYLLFTYNAPPGLTAPVWSPIAEHACPTPPGPKEDGCTVSGRLIRITIDQTTHSAAPGSEVALIKDDWCQQFTSHSVGDLQFGPEGALYVSAGAGGDWGKSDYGQLGGAEGDMLTPANPCGDPSETSGPGPGIAGVTREEPPTAEGGMLRAQSFRRPADQPATLDGTIARVDPNTGEPLPSNPNFANSDLDRRRIVAYGFRQPFRFVLRPGTNPPDVWIADVGESTWEEIDDDPAPLEAPTRNFGWPCYEGKEKEPDASYTPPYTEFGLCTSLYAANTATEPVYAYKHSESVVAGDNCAVNKGGSISAIGFEYGGPYSSTYEHALFFGDYSRDCMWAMLPDTPTGLPDPNNLRLVFNGREEPSANPGAGYPVDIEVGPDKNLYYVNRNIGQLRRLSDTNFPTAVATADTPTGVGPLVMTFSSSGSQAPESEPTYHWDFGDGDSSDEAEPPPHTYASPGIYTATLTVTDKGNGNSDTTSILVTVDRPLHAAASADTTEGPGPLTVHFTGHKSTAPDSIAAYRWDFGDGTSAYTPDATHTYAAPGSYTAALTVTDPGHVPGMPIAATATVHVTVLAPVPLGSPVGALAPTVGAPGPTVGALVLGGARLESTRFAAAPSSALHRPIRHHGYTTGTTLRFRLSQNASVKLSFAKRIGRGKHARWVSVAARGVVVTCGEVARAGKRPRELCRHPASDHISIAAGAGADAYVLSGWVGGMALPPGSYRLTLRASAAAAVSAPENLSFVVAAAAIGSSTRKVDR